VVGADDVDGAAGDDDEDLDEAGADADGLRNRADGPRACARVGCGKEFSFFRKPVYCRHCGQQFCGGCCSSKVPRSYFGATAPAAQKETVRVCKDCKDYLATK
jgi:hypothetical protein